MAKILFYTTFDGGLGADRWIINGYRSAFIQLGHQFFTSESEKYPLQHILKSVRPDIFVAPVSDMAKHYSYCLDLISSSHIEGKKNLFFVDTYFKQDLAFIKQLEKYCLTDFYFGYYASELMTDFEEAVGRKYHQIPLAADSSLHYPVEPDRNYIADISFIGNRLPTKEAVFTKLLLPLCKNFLVKIYGPGWTKRDQFLRLVSGVSRKGHFFKVAEWVNKKRLSVLPEEERKVYSSSKICLNIHEYYSDGQSKNFSNEREFKIPACGGFQISDAVIGIEKFFKPDKEIVIAKNYDDWFKKIEYYIRNDHERKRIQKNGTRRALQDHTYLHRAKMIMNLCQLT